VRIPLDYYRILGVPIQATAEQVRQYWRDRTMQLPRREYSAAAISARRQLLDEAYEVLSDPQQRQEYDSRFLAQTYERTTTEQPEAASPLANTGSNHTPSIEIHDDQLIGALIILQEVGEYEHVLQLGRPYLSSSWSHSRDASQTSEASPSPSPATSPSNTVSEIARSDIALAVALAYLELGREQWSLGQYERAASSLEAGQALLLREGLFPQIRGEMQADLYTLRPYRILENLALPESQSSDGAQGTGSSNDRERGLRLLREIIAERGGIDGSQDDRSGLSVDDFLRFIQQVRCYMTASEQQTLFESEARRPSAVATYLAVYALIARGFAEREPALVLRAKQTLIHLGRRQDVNLEKAICCLLLGQTEAANYAIELSQEEEPIQFIRQHSTDAPDLLPGLCLYAERWLREEVFPYFRDLAEEDPSLKEYFADSQVQQYLEELSQQATDESAQSQWVEVPPTETATTASLEGSQSPSPNVSVPGAWHTQSPSSYSSIQAPQFPGSRQSSSAEWQENTQSRLGASSSGDRSLASTEPTYARREDRGSHAPSVSYGESRRYQYARYRGGSSTGKDVNSIKIGRLLLVGLGGLLLLWLIFIVIRGTFGWIYDRFSPEPEIEVPMSLNEPFVESPDPQPSQPKPDDTLTQTLAEKIIRNWLEVKGQAMGPQHQIELLDTVLMDPARSQWQQRAADARSGNWYWQYQQHSISVTNVAINPENDNRAKVTAEVQEKGTLFDNGQPIRQQNSSLRVQYQLQRQNDSWKIRDWQILN
jgi:curved DNA-binding protein CbpA